MLRITSLTCALVLSACAIETADETATVQAAAGCPTWGCGENSPVMGPYGNWWELNVNGYLNNENMKVEAFVMGSTEYKPQVKGAQLYATHPVLPTLTGTSLTNGYFRIRTPTGTYRLNITHVNPKASSNVTYWVGPLASIETYELTWSGPGGTGRVCENPPPRDGLDGGVWSAPTEAIFFTGDRYHADSKRVTHADYASTSGWFNIGCAGSALAKLHLNRHTTAGSTVGFTTTADQRQTLLKMYVSDVCGGGEAWTTAGTPLHFQQTSGWSKLGGGEWAFEMQWGPGGAVCMDNHRKGTLYTDPANAPNIIAYSCPDQKLPPPCNQTPSSFAFLPGAYIASAVPSFVP